MITLKNEQLTVQIAELGAELQSVRTADGEERLWQADPAFWGRRAPILFPVVGRLRELRFVHEGKDYNLGAHGFARDSLFAVETQTETEVTFLLRDSEQTRACYPFAFEFRATYALVGNRVSVTYAVYNPDEKPLFMSFGGHEAYACPEGVSAYDIVLPEPRTMDSYLVDNVTLNAKKRVFDNSAVLPLKDELFENDALVFENPQLPYITLRRRSGGRDVTVYTEGVEYLLLWMKPGAGYLCIEPWWGVGGFEDDSFVLAEKRGIHRVDGGERFAATHTIEF